MDSIGVRELRQNASRYLDRVKKGESIEVTERGVPVAVLSPLPAKRRSRYQQMVEDGLITPGSGNLREILARPRPPLDPNYEGPSIAQILDELRGDKI